MKELEHNTETKITVPSVNDQSETITVTGTKEGIERAIHEIRTISDEQVCIKKGVHCLLLLIPSISSKSCMNLFLYE